MIKKKIYRGIAFTNYKQSKTLSMADIDLVKRDLLNHIYTAVGERRMMPTFGTVIPEMPFEQMDEITLDIIEESVLYVINYDPRVELVINDNTVGSGVRMVSLYDEHIIVAAAEVRYIELDLTEVLEIHLEFSA